MTSMATLATDQAASSEQALPNKFIYPEFAGFNGEKLMRRIVKAILPRALYITWETIEEEHAYGNDCFLSLCKVAKDARRTRRTVNRNIATLMGRGLLVLRSEFKFCRRSDGSMYKKAVVVKDFSGLYALAHEYYEWQFSEDYLAPEYEYTEHMKGDPRLQAKLCRFEDYRRLMEYHRDPFAQVEVDRRFTEYDPSAPLNGDEERAENANEETSDQNKTNLMPKERPNCASKVSKERINEKAHSNSQKGDSFDSDESLETGREADATPTSISKPGARDYTKQVRRYETDKKPNKSQTNSIPPSPNKNVPPGAGNASFNDESNHDVRSAQDAMAKTGATRPARHQTEELPPPPKHPLARSFVHEVATLFGDQNEKGSKTGIERRIEGFELDQPMDVLLCLVRAYIVARDTKDEKIRQRRPDGKPNRMPLFCTMFERFAQALGPGSKWQYTYQQMFENIAADDRLSLWLSEHQTDLAEGGSNQSETPQPLAFVEELTEEEVSEAGEEPESDEDEELAEDIEEREPEEDEEPEPDDDEEQKEEREHLTKEEEPGEEAELAPAQGWKTSEMAYDWAAYLVEKLIENNYGDLEVNVSLPRHGDRYQIIVQNAAGTYYCLVCREDVRGIMAMARKRTLFADPVEVGD